MTVFLNGEFVPEAQALVPVTDRSFRYGDGIFETLLVVNGRPFRWRQHWERLTRGAQLLRVQIPSSAEALISRGLELCRINAHDDAVLRISISRGTGARGYAPDGSEKPVLVLTTVPLPPPPARAWDVTVASLRVAEGDAISQHKTGNRLINVLATIEARERGADDALLLNTAGHVTEASSSNVFVINRGAVITPPAAAGALPGITRETVMDLCQARGIALAEETFTPHELLHAEGAFLTMSTKGLVEIASVDGKPLARSPLVRQLAAAYWELVRAECGGIN